MHSYFYSAKTNGFYLFHSEMSMKIHPMDGQKMQFQLMRVFINFFLKVSQKIKLSLRMEKGILYS
ncbi:hypothetical protein SODG_002840 [Sodalis praecaptivus]